MYPPLLVFLVLTKTESKEAARSLSNNQGRNWSEVYDFKEIFRKIQDNDRGFALLAITECESSGVGNAAINIRIQEFVFLIKFNSQALVVDLFSNIHHTPF